MTRSRSVRSLAGMLTNSLNAAVAARSAARSEEPIADVELAISVRDLHKKYDHVEAVRGVDLDVRRGEIFAFLGPNGAGKTTTVEILEGFREASSGHVRVLGVDPAHGGAHWRARLGIVLQESAPEVGLSTRECLSLYAGYYRRPRRVDETLALVGLLEQADQRAAALSGGQRRRLDVALALIGDPELVFLDEPTTGFDPSARRAAWDVIDGLRALGKTVLLTTHYMEEAERLADRIAVIARGRIVAVGAPARLGGRDRDAAEITFSLPQGVSVADLPGTVAGRLAVPAAVGPDRLELISPHVAEDLHALSGWALRAGVELDDLEVRRPTLEDTYLRLIGNDSDDHEGRA